MKKIYFFALIATFAMLTACSKGVDETCNPTINTQSELSIGLPINISRTAIDVDGRASWIEGDSFALWAENRTGGLSLNGAEFKMMYYWHSAQEAVFTSNANSLAEGTYTYYAVSPKPESTNGLKATFTLPAEQRGDVFNGAYDIMVAEPIEAAALSADKGNDLALDFQHKMHVLKVTIAKNNLKGKVKKLIFTFPSEVVGKVTIDAANANGSPVLESASRKLTINCGDGVDEGDTVWGVVFPQNISGDIKVNAVGLDDTKSQEKIVSISKDMAEGHITPLSLTIPRILPTLRFTIGKNNLGEAIERLTITDHNGNSISVLANNENEYDFVVTEEYGFDKTIFDHYEGKTFKATFESRNAIVSTNFVMPSELTDGVNIIPALTVPYLFFEDFTSIHTNFEKDDSRVANLMEANGMLLNNYMSVPGWNGAHIKGVKGQCVRVNVRHQSTMGTTRSNGRLDTPTMSNLKSGANVKLKVTFDMGAYVNSGYSSDNEVFCIAGVHNSSTSSALNGVVSTTFFSAAGDDKDRVKSVFSNVSYTSEYLAAGYNADSFGSTFPTHSFTQTGCTSSTRICWVPCCVQSHWTTSLNAHYYLYIDNIRVSIAE
mgnify:CR=1 FL=1